MCAFCSTTGIPVCTVDGSCGQPLIEGVKHALLVASPIVGGVTVSIKNTLKSKKLKKSQEKVINIYR